MLWTATFLIVFGLLAYHRASMSVSSIALLLLLLFYSKFGAMSWFALGLTWLILAPIVLVLNHSPLRLKLVSKRLFTIIRNFMPALSDTERAALEAGGAAGDQRRMFPLFAAHAKPGAVLMKTLSAVAGQATTGSRTAMAPALMATMMATTVLCGSAKSQRHRR